MQKYDREFSKRVEDKDLAHEMALAEDSRRTMARTVRIGGELAIKAAKAAEVARNSGTNYEPRDFLISPEWRQEAAGDKSLRSDDVDYALWVSRGYKADLYTEGQRNQLRTDVLDPLAARMDEEASAKGEAVRAKHIEVTSDDATIEIPVAVR